ncbi:MAG TPA: hypothetical protein VEX15_12255 [Nocardioidaceae bacterium]|nr:hypothetical protein [Nocardioidaceae bacterium]
MSSVQSNQASHVPPYYYFAQDQQEKLDSLWQKRTASKGRLRSLLSRRSAR